MRRLLALLFACSLPGIAAAGKPAPPTVPAPAAKAPTPKAPKEALLAAADEIIRQVAALRGLAVKQPIQRGVLTRAEIGAKLRERIAKEYTPGEVRAEGRVLKRLGLLPPEADYEKLILDLLMDQVAGFYDPFVGKLYIADWLPLEMQRPALAHEIEHALQDQHFGLKQFSQPIKDDGDRQLARSSLVEGDGTAVMLEFTAQSMGLPIDQLPAMAAQIGKSIAQGGMATSPVFDQAPAFLKETLVFPYFGGLGFVESVRKDSPWPKVNEMFKNPPESTEQILHPEKYFAHEAPVKIVPATLASLGARTEIRRDVLGEIEWKILFASKLPEEVAEKAAAGWGGDRLVAYADPGAESALPTLVLLSTWDSETDAKEAEAAARTLVAKLAQKPEPAAAAPALFTSATGEEWAVERHRAELLVVFGAPAGLCAPLQAEVWKSWKVGK